MDDKKLFEISCKEALMRIVQESETLNKKLTFFQKTLLYDKIKEMSLSEVLSILKEADKKESSGAKAAKYGLAGYVGRKAGKIAIGGAPLKVPFGPEIIKGRKKYYKSSKGLNIYGKIGKGFKLTKNIKIPAKTITPGGIRGALAGVTGLFLFRKLSDPCIRQNLTNPSAIKKCKANAAKRVIAQIQKEMKECNNMSNPEACKKRLEKSLIKMQETLRKNI